jgi:hypothetical protein
MSAIEPGDEQGDVWNLLYDQIRSVLIQYGRENAFREGDYWVDDDNMGYRRILVTTGSGGSGLSI